MQLLLLLLLLLLLRYIVYRYMLDANALLRAVCFLIHY
jgi:hypothetical protein